MTKAKIEGLISQLHDRIGDEQTSPEQARMLAELQGQLTGSEALNPGNGDPRTTAELLLEDIEERHPKAAMVLREIIDTLHHAGL